MDIERRTLDIVGILSLLALGTFISASTYLLLIGKIEFNQYAATVGPLTGTLVGFFKKGGS